jgi:hypothetical protein
MTESSAEPCDLRCPSCGTALAAGVVQCSHCGFTGQDTIALFGDSSPTLKEMVDAVDCWTAGQIQTIRKAQLALRRRFPQIRTHVEAVALPAGASPATYGFWRINTAPRGRHESGLHRTWTVLLVFDLASGTASVSCGYRVSQLIDDAEWVRILESIKPLWEKGRRGFAVREFFSKLETVLQRTWKEKGKAYES